MPRFSRGVPIFANAADNGLDQPIDALFLVAVHDAEAKFRLALRSFVEAHGELSAQIVLNEGGLVARAFRVPGVHDLRKE